MALYNSNRGGIIQIIIGVIFVILIGQLISLQVVSNKYKLAADNNAIFRKIIYPDRGIIYDRKKRALLENTISYDLVVIPNEAKGVDTNTLCEILKIDKEEYKKRMIEVIIKNSRVKAGTFEPFLTPELYAQLTENLYRFPGFSLSERSIRNYPYNTAAHVLGYVAEVDVNFLQKHEEEGYEMGDYAGMTGLEKQYESILMGQRGVKRYLRDNKGRIQGAYEKGEFDTLAIAGKNLFTSMDVEVQQLAEKLLQNKVGSAVAINPKTGGVIAMASSPGYNPNLLTGSQRRKTIGRLLLDTARPIYNRAIKGQYPPGSTFKPLGAIIALTHDVLMMLGFYSIFDGILPFTMEVDQAFIAAVLTIIGFSINDTVVVFDRIREYLGTHQHETNKEGIINNSLNKTLSRTVITSLTVFMVALVLFIFGGEVIKGFTFALLIGIVFGTYSSIAIATPIVIDFDKTNKGK